MESKREYRINDIHFFQNGEYEGVDIAWGGPIGFGHLQIYKNVGEDIKEIRAYPLPDLAQAAVGVAFTQVVEIVLVDISEDSWQL